jgi:hypothetical protein
VTCGRGLWITRKPSRWQRSLSHWNFKPEKILLLTGCLSSVKAFHEKMGRHEQPRQGEKFAASATQGTNRNDKLLLPQPLTCSGALPAAGHENSF